MNLLQSVEIKTKAAFTMYSISSHTGGFRYDEAATTTISYSNFRFNHFSTVDMNRFDAGEKTEK